MQLIKYLLQNRDFQFASTSSQSENRGFVPIGSHSGKPLINEHRS